jgi:hypothetical protein
MSRHPSLKFSIFLLCLLLAWGTIPVRAATINVTTTADSGAGSLREALTNAGAGDTITFTISGTIQLLSNLPDITANGLTINGNGATINGGTDIRVFTITGNVSVTINNLTMTGGGCNSACPRQYDFGGGIYNTGTLTISNSTLSSNSATNGGGGIYNASGTVTLTNSTLSSNSATYGSGIYNASGTMTISNSTLSGNSAFDGGGGIYNASGTVTISNSTLSGNSANGGGGGIYNDGTLTLSNSTLSSNSARTGIGGGIRNNGGTLTINNSTLSGNSASYGGGGIYNSSGTVSISNSTLSGNSVRSGGGGGIANEGTVVLSNSTLSGNSATNGGSIGNWGGTATLKNTLLDKGASGANCYGTFASNGAAYNLANDGSCGAGVTQVASLGLGTLGANDGPTQTIPLLTGSPAINAALAADCPPPISVDLSVHPAQAAT